MQRLMIMKVMLMLQGKWKWSGGGVKQEHNDEEQCKKEQYKGDRTVKME